MGGSDDGKSDDEEGLESGDEDSLDEADDFAKKQKLHERQKDKGYPRLRIKQVRPKIP